MNRRYLIPTRSIDDAENALARLPAVMEQGDEVVAIIASDVPEAELIGSRPSARVIDPLAITGGVSSEPRATADRPVFIGREEIMDLRGRELCDALRPKIAGLLERAYSARVEALFSHDPDVTILDYATDLRATGIYVTPEFLEALDEGTWGSVQVL